MSFLIFFFFNDTATTEIYTLSLHDALPFHSTASSTSSPHGADCRRYGRGSGSCSGLGTRAASRAATGTTQGEIDVAKLLPRCGPSGRYSQAWMSRADQSLTRTAPKTWPGNAATSMGCPAGDPTPTTNPSSASMSSRCEGPNEGAGSAAALRCPLGRVMGVPDTTTVPARPW